MKMIVVVALALVAVVAAAPVDEPIKTLRSEFVQTPDGGFSSAFETENGINQNQVGELKQVTDEDNKPQTVVVLRGSYAYTDPEGKAELVQYYADETGYHAEGESIPKAPVV